MEQKSNQVYYPNTYSTVDIILCAPDSDLSYMLQSQTNSVLNSASFKTQANPRLTTKNGQLIVSYGASFGHRQIIAIQAIFDSKGTFQLNGSFLSPFFTVKLPIFVIQEYDGDRTKWNEWTSMFEANFYNTP